MIYRRILQAGVELEGSWDAREGVPLLHHDGSVTTVGHMTGEHSTRPMKPKQLLEFLASDAYPDYVNDSCGMHVHISTNNSDYAALMHEHFNTAFRFSMSKWAKANVPDDHPFWPRWDGRNEYCSTNFIPLQQYHCTSRSYSRYTALNYCSGLHGTLECRLLPMMETRSLAVSAVRHYLEFVETWLRANAKRYSGKVNLTVPFGEEVDHIVIRAA